MRFLRSVVIGVFLGALASAPALAKRPSDYVPPPYFTRFVHGIIGLAPFTVVLLIITLGALLFFRSRRRGSLPIIVIVSAALVVAGSLLAAADWLNDELWEPCLGGSVFISFVPTAAVYLSLPKRSIWALIPASALAFPTWFVIVVTGIPLQAWAFNRGLPVSW